MGLQPLRRRVLVVEDDQAMQVALRGSLEPAGYEVRIVGDGRQAIDALVAFVPSLVILDLGLPGADGASVLRRIRGRSAVPVLVLSGRTGDVEKARLLLAGADDYVGKPFSRIELLARLEALLRRFDAVPSDAEVVRALEDGALRLDLSAREAWLDGEPLLLSTTEFSFLAKIMAEPGRAVPYDELLRDAWLDTSGLGADRVKFAVMRLRKKLGAPFASRIEPVRGFGYRWRDAAAGTDVSDR